MEAGERLRRLLTAAVLDSLVEELKCCQRGSAFAVSPEKLAFQALKPQFPFPNGTMKPTRYVSERICSKKIN